MAQILIKKTGNTIPYNDVTSRMYAKHIQSGLAEVIGEVETTETKEPIKKKVEDADVVEPTKAPEFDYDSLNIKELKKMAKERGVSLKANTPKAEIINLLK